MNAPSRPAGPVFLTGGTGLIGSRVLAMLAARSGREVRCLARSVAPATVWPNLQIVTGDLEAPESYADALEGATTVLHLAAKVGMGPREAFDRVNNQGTRALVDACRTHGVEEFIFVSSIAATFPDRTAYAYADSKRAAEDVVRASGLRYLIVRPTLVFGEASPVWQNLSRFATLPIVPIVGDGRVRVQPIHVDDVANFLVGQLMTPLPGSGEVDLGGPDIMTMEELLRRIGRARLGRERPVVHLPARITIGALASLERWVGALPVSAGQLAVFVNDSTAQAHPPPEFDMKRLRTLDEMLTLLVGR
jgi:NADH dehydrogenase